MTAEINALANDALDIAYAEDTESTLRGIANRSLSPLGTMQNKLKALDKEATSLAEQSLKFNVTDKSLNEAFETYEDILAAAQTETVATAVVVEQSAAELATPTVAAKLFPQRTDEFLSQGVNPLLANFGDDVLRAFNFPDPVEFVDFYTDTTAWEVRMERWGAGYADLSKDTLLKGMAQGWGPIRTARIMRQHAENIPARASNNLLRTLQITSYRDAQLALEIANGHLLRGKIRIAVLDSATCLACIALHGTRLAVGQRVDDHYSGRCSEFYQVPGGPDFPLTMQADSKPGLREFVPFQNGIAWFDGLSSTRQAAQNSFLSSPGKLRLFKSGESLNIFIGNYHDDIFGAQIIEQSIKRAITGFTP